MSDVLAQIEDALRRDSEARRDEALDAAYVEIVSLRDRLDDALGIVRAIFDTGAEDKALATAIMAFLDGERRRGTLADTSQVANSPAVGKSE